LQGCSVLAYSDVIQDITQVHTVVEQLQAHVFHVLGAKDVEGKTSEFAEDVGVGSDTRLVFPQGYIPDIVVSILNTPVISDAHAELFSTQNSCRDVE
jgi:hypothetical protein